MSTVLEAQVNLMRRIRENSSGLVTNVGTQEIWDTIAIPYYLRAEEPFWNLYTRDGMKNISVAPTKSISSGPNVVLKYPIGEAL